MNEATVNGQQRALTGIGAHTTALDWLRSCGLTGAKEGCAEGECGACAVLVAQPAESGRSAESGQSVASGQSDGADGADQTQWASVNSCLIPAAALNGQEVVTSEGLGSPADLHPVQSQMAANGSSQCGYCTPGFACSMAAEFYRCGRAGEAADVDGERSTDGAVTDDGGKPADGAVPADGTVPDDEHGPNGFDLHALSGNLCRCTGYRPIRDAAFALGAPQDDDPLAARRRKPAPGPVATDITGDDGRFVRPATLGETLDLMAGNPDATVVAGATDFGVEVNQRGRRDPLLIAVDRIDELRTFEATDSHVEIGAALSLSEVERKLDGRLPLLEGMFPQFASRLIRNRATIGGNLGTGSPIGDAPPALLALGARIVLVSPAGEREVDLDGYFTGYRQTVRRDDELIKSVRIPLPVAPLTAFHKIAKRRFDDISSVAIAIAGEVADGVITRARIGIGGAAATPLRAHDTERALLGNPWNEATINEAAAVLGAEGTPMDDHRASAAYRQSMLAQALKKFHAENDETLEVSA
ncbi:xanthine dehydrogenase small subunit [Arthrobacter castelli]|uniref:xanthine dehydrogenase small subunit n=1 Tax=Arthrobacter castelli TaxID=271431 RepID=UPI00047E7CF3|nr:FAD binding domain-containing protein [Arthrobacter castelli]